METLCREKLSQFTGAFPTWETFPWEMLSLFGNVPRGTHGFRKSLLGLPHFPKFLY